MEDKLDIFLDQFYGKYSPNDIPQGERRARLKQKLSSDFDGYVTQMYSKYAPDNVPDSTRLSSLRSKYSIQSTAQSPSQQQIQQPQQIQPTEENIGWWQSVKNAFNRGLASAEQAEYVTFDPEKKDVAKIAALQKEMQSLPVSQAYQKFSGAKSTGEALSAFAENPLQVLSELTVESLTAMGSYGATRVAGGAGAGAALTAWTGPGAAVGAGIGAVAGLADTSLMLEYSGKFMETLQEAGVDVTNPQSLEQAFSDDAMVSKARNLALKKGIPIAVFDLISGGVAGKIVTKPATSLGKKALAGGAEFGIQAGLGGAGELAGQVSAGEQINPSAIIGEMIGELGTTPIEVANAARTFNRRQKVADQTIDDVTGEVSPEIKTQIDIDAQEAISAPLQNLNEQKNAIQEQATGQVPIQSEATGSQEVQSTLTEAEPQATTQEGEVTPEKPRIRVMGEAVEPSTQKSIADEFIEGDRVLFQGTGESLSDNKQNAIEQLADYLREKSVTGLDNVKSFLADVSSRMQGFPQLTDTDAKEINSLLTVPKPKKSTRVVSDVDLLKKQIKDVEAGYKRGNKDARSIFKQVYDVLNSVDLKRRDRINIMGEFNRLDIRNEQDVADFFNTLYTKIEGAESNKVLTATEQIKESATKFAQGLTQGVKKGGQIFKDQIKNIQAIAKEAGMNRSQVSAILTKLRGYSPFSGESGAKLSSFIFDVANDAVYAQKINRARSTVGKLRESLKKLTGDEREVARGLAFVDVTGLSKLELENFLNLAERSLPSVFPVKTKGATFSPMPLAEASKYVDDYVNPIYDKEVGGEAETIKQKIEQINAARAKKRLLADIDTTGLTEEQINALVDEQLIAKRLEKTENKKKIREVLQAMAKVAKDSMPEQAPQVSNKTSQSVATKIYNKIKDIDIALLNDEQLKVYIKAVDRIVQNGDYGNAGTVAVIADVQKGVKTIVSILEKTKLIPVSKLQGKLSTLPVLFKSMLALDKVAVQFQTALGLSDTFQAKAKAENTKRQLEKAVDDVHSKYPSSNKSESIARQGVYKNLIEYTQGVSQEDALKNNKELVERDIATLRATKDEKNIETANELERLYKPFRDAKKADGTPITTIDEVKDVMKKMDRGGYEVVSTISNFFEQRAQDLVDYNYFYFGLNTDVVNNYAGPRKYITVGEAYTAIGENFDDIIFPSGDFATYYKPKQSAQAKSRQTVVKRDDSGNIEPYQQGKKYKIRDYNIQGIAYDSFEKNVFEMDAYPSMLQSAMIRNDVKVEEAMVKNLEKDKGGKTLYDLLFSKDTGAYESYIKSSLGQMDSDGKTWLGSFLRSARGLSMKMTLGAYSQIINQTLPTASNVLLRTGVKHFASGIRDVLFKNDTDLRTFLNTKSASQREDLGSFGHLGDFGDKSRFDNILKGALVDLKRSRFVKGLRKGSDIISGQKALTYGDLKVAEVSYIAFYKKYLEDNNLKFEGWGREMELEDTPSRKQAIAYAENMVDVLQTASDPNKQADILKSRETVYQVAKSVMIPYGTFAMNQRVRLLGAYKAMRYGNAEQKAAGAKELAATLTETLVFKGLKYATKGALAYAALGAFGGDDEDEDRDKLEVRKEREKLVADIGFTVLTEIALPTVLLAPDFSRNGLAASLNYLTLQTYNEMNPDDELTPRQFQDIAPFPVSPATRGEVDLGLLNLLVPAAGAPVQSLENVIKSIDQLQDEEGEISEEDKKVIQAVLAANILSTTQLFPADIRFALERESRRREKRRKGTAITPSPLFNPVFGEAE